MRQLTWMLAGRRQQQWLQTAEILAMLANTNLERFRRKSAFTRRHFLPDDIRREMPTTPLQGHLTVDDMTTFLEPE